MSNLNNLNSISSLKPKKYICIHNDISSQDLEINHKKLAAITDMFHLYGYDIVLTGTDSAKKFIHKLKSHMNFVPIDMIDKTDNPSLISVLKQSYLVISNNENITQIAESLNVTNFMTIDKIKSLFWCAHDSMYHRIIVNNSQTGANDSYSEAEKLMKNVYGSSN